MSYPVKMLTGVGCDGTHACISLFIIMSHPFKVLAGVGCDGRYETDACSSLFVMMSSGQV